MEKYENIRGGWRDWGQHKNTAIAATWRNGELELVDLCLKIL